MAKKFVIKVGDRVSWKVYGGKWNFGFVEKIVPKDKKSIKVRPDATYKGEKTTLAAIKSKNIITIR